MPTLEKYVKRAKGISSSKGGMMGAMNDTKTEGMKAQMDYSANARKKQDNSPMKSGPNGKTCK